LRASLRGYHDFIDVGTGRAYLLSLSLRLGRHRSGEA
jgi:hypothetical protein